MNILYECKLLKVRCHELFKILYVHLLSQLLIRFEYQLMQKNFQYQCIEFK